MYPTNKGDKFTLNGDATQTVYEVECFVDSKTSQEANGIQQSSYAEHTMIRNTIGGYSMLTDCKKVE